MTRQSRTKFMSQLLFVLAIIANNGYSAESSNCESALIAGPQCFQLGDAWNKTELKAPGQLSEISERLRPAIAGTAQFMLGASGVLLGKFQNQWIMASSYHMCSQNVGGPCRPIMLRGSLRLLGIPFQGQEIIGYWPENDLMLFTVEFDASDEDKLVGVGQSFDFKSKLKSGSPLVAAGYTLINGFSGNLQINADSDCKILSQTGETRLIADPDSLRPDSEKKWAFAMGCDIARGDSGGPVIDKDTGKVVGLVWTAKNPTTAFARSSSNLEGLRQAHDARLWTEAAYATSSLKMSETLRRFINDPKVTDENHKSLVRALLEQ